MIELPPDWPPNPWPTRFRTARASSPDLGDDDVRFLTVDSPALRGRGDVLVSHAGVETGESVDVVVLFHGVYGSFWNWAYSGGAHLAHRRLADGGHRNVLLVMPSDGLDNEGTLFISDGDRDCAAWVDHAIDASVEMVNGTVRSVSYIGTSMGGFAAAYHAARQPRLGAVVMHSPITHVDHLAGFTVEDLGARANLRPEERSSLHYIDGSFDRRLLLDCGRDDFLLPTVQELHRCLEDQGVAHSYAEVDGGHSWDVWRERIDVSLQFVVETVAGLGVGKRAVGNRV